MPYVSIENSLLVGGPTEIHYRSTGSGTPLVFLHGGWGYEIYPLDLQASAVQDFRLLIPDRTGYGRSTKPAIFDADLHRRALQETLQFLDALRLERCIFWGHSDGAVIAALLGLTVPERCLGLVMEAFHYDREKPHSRAFFQAMVSDPDTFGARVSEVLKKEHGEPYWRELVRGEGQAWLDIAKSAAGNCKDLFDGRLSQLRVPAVFIHGADDPRTEPWELAAVRGEVPSARVNVIPGGGHSPHSETASAAEFSRLLRQAMAFQTNIHR